MAYSTSNPPICIARGGQYGGALWKYDTTDATGTVDTAGYITNADKLGMKKGDLVLRTTWSALPDEETDLVTGAATAPTISSMGWHVVLGVTAGGSCDLTDTTALTVTNTD